MRRVLWLIVLMVFGLTLNANAQRIKLSLSLKELEARAAKDSLDAAAHYNVALALWNEKRYDEVERRLKLATALDSKFAEGYLALAFLPYARRPKLWDEVSERGLPDEWKKPMEESDRNYRRAFLINPMVDLRILGAVRPGKSALWDLYAPEFYDFYYQAFDDVATGNYQQALGRFRNLHRELRIAGPGIGRLPMFVWWYQGVAAAHTGDWTEASGAFQTLINDMEEYERKKEVKKELIQVPLRTNEYRYFLATVRQASGMKEEALKLYREVLENDIGIYMAHVQVANIFESDRRFAEAVESRQAAINANPDDASLLMDLGVTLGKAGRFKDAEEALVKAAEANPRDVRSLFWLGICRVQLGRKDDAKATFKQFLALAPSRWEKQIASATQALATLQ